MLVTNVLSERGRGQMEVSQSVSATTAHFGNNSNGNKNNSDSDSETIDCVVDCPIVLIPSDPPGSQKSVCEDSQQQQEEDIIFNEGLSLECNAWDACLLIGLSWERGSLVSTFQTVLMALLMLANMVCQFLLILAVQGSMGSDPLDHETKVGAVMTRFLTNHRWQDIDLLNTQTMADAVCSGQKLSSLTTLYGDISDYLNLGNSSFMGLPGTQGWSVALLGMLIWILSMSTEIRRTLELATAVLWLPGTRLGNIHVDRDRAEDIYVISRLSVAQKAGQLFLVLLPRLIIAVLLLFYGLKWLANTLNVGDIILNACALEIVKNIDEYLFDAIMPHQLRIVLSNTRYLYEVKFEDQQESVQREGSHCWAVVRIVFIGSVLAGGYFHYVPVLHGKITDFQEYICSGSLSFAWQIHPVTQAIVFTDLNHRSQENKSAVELLVWPNRMIQITDHSKQRQNTNKTTSKSLHTVIWNKLRWSS
ncbi:unnamed protein product [Polarella glacialis]|uniref:Uncharacterized protein n=1 Tax=Polarella glacialis TaxID=89957 RepID=A0A813JXZ4_POLGL|nr:unnamed protein product [Polarella glacialis]